MLRMQTEARQILHEAAHWVCAHTAIENYLQRFLTRHTRVMRSRGVTTNSTYRALCAAFADVQRKRKRAQLLKRYAKKLDYLIEHPDAIDSEDDTDDTVPVQ